MINYPIAVFDFDGTLCASDAAIFACLQKTFEHYKKMAPSETHLRTVMSNGVGMVDALKLLNPELMATDEARVQEWLQTYRRFSKAVKRPLYDKVVEVLKQVHAANVIITIVSNNTVANIQTILKENHIQNLVSCIIGIESGQRNHTPMFFMIALPLYPNRPTSDLMIGDTATDIQFAQNTGMDCCWVQYGIGHTQDCQALSQLHY